MNVLGLLLDRFRPALEPLVADEAKRAELLDMIRPAQDAKFGDYQANFAMPLGKLLGQPPRTVAAQLIAAVKLDDCCQPPEIAGPGFINLRLRDDWIANQLAAALPDERLGIAPVAPAKTYVIDYSSPNVAKPMHVGHIRSTVIGDAICRTLRFLGHRVISDNHLGDWGTQFGMILYGYKRFRDDAEYRRAPVAELSRLYRLVQQIISYLENKRELPEVERKLAAKQAELHQLEQSPVPADKGAAKKRTEEQKRLTKQIAELSETLDGTPDAQFADGLRNKLANAEKSAPLMKLVAEHALIEQAVLEETAKLHAGDAENLRLWHEFLPNCRDEIQRVYRRLDVQFDFEYGESFYHDQLAGVVEDFKRRGLATESQGAICVFLDGFDAPMIVQKKDGAFLYSTTDLATIQFRVETWQPNAILYVVDHRQGDHFDKLFAAAKKWGYDQVELTHVAFGTVMGSDGKPYKTRSGDTVGLEGLLDEAVRRALAIVQGDKVARGTGGELSPAQQQEIAEVVGIGALKYADLSQNRSTDYVFSYDKMLALDGNTAAYMQMAYARVRSIFSRGEIDVESLRRSSPTLALTHPAERTLALALLRFAEALCESMSDYRPNTLTAYLYDQLAKSYSAFFENCPVLKAESDAAKTTRLVLCDLTARTMKLGLELLGIRVVERM